jgi:hypothetical protein
MSFIYNICVYPWVYYVSTQSAGQHVKKLKEHLNFRDMTSLLKVEGHGYNFPNSDTYRAITAQYRFASWQSLRGNDKYNEYTEHATCTAVSPVAPTPAANLATRPPWHPAAAQINAAVRQRTYNSQSKQLMVRLAILKDRKPSHAVFKTYESGIERVSFIERQFRHISQFKFCW